MTARDGAAEVEEAAEAKAVDLPDGGQWQVMCDEDACEVRRRRSQGTRQRSDHSLH